MLALIAKYNGKCTKCKGRIRKGDPIGFDRYRHITLCTNCHTEHRLKMHEHEARNTAAYVQAQEEAYFERHHEDYVFLERITDYIH